ncbi:cupin domain-containing protein [Kordiimonas sp. SCSIO 12603]|uniref:cupin domain-containing protein n=1 Tax=Kordiimonas sp. SCSIO 12603 TaxID=2829596 RepID=UPI002101FBFA|nr:cupin domain-containing protein [Kordiimonas sp. SCSIO 12603]UTW58117.1 cupin domain-containing protein [Kordiimonas sp. SCSIO 12603]
MRKILLTSLALCASIHSFAEEKKPAISAEPLLKSAITGIDNHEVLMARVTVAANSEAARHYHPTEEYLYVLSGSTILRIDDQEDVLLKAGMHARIPAKMIHTAITKEEPTELIVFRVHPKGQPIRKLAPN